MRDKLTQERLKERLKYDPATGDFTWIGVSRGPKRADNKAGSWKGVDEKYWQVCVDGVPYLAHRLAWLYVYGRFPKGHLDHRDGDGRNNRIKNLREATLSQNGGNRRPNKGTKSGFKGVAAVSKHHHWRAYITLGRKHLHLGCFSSAEDAAKAYDKAAKKAFGRFARLNFP